MGIEIERKFLVSAEKWSRTLKGEGQVYRQGYILRDPDKTIRVRLSDEQGFITVKGASTGASRPEYEYEIPLQDAKELLDNFCTSEISKIRYEIYFAGKLLEVDEFLDDNEGLIIAEIELSSVQD